MKPRGGSCLSMADSECEEGGTSMVNQCYIEILDSWKIDRAGENPTAYCVE